MQASKHNYEPVGCDNAAFENSFTSRDVPARKNLNRLFQQSKAHNINESNHQLDQRVLETNMDMTDSAPIQRIGSQRDEDYVEINLDDEDDDGLITNRKRVLDANRLSKSLSTLNDIGQNSNLYPIEATTILDEDINTSEDETELKNSPLRTPSFKTAISSSETKIETEKIQAPSSVVKASCSSTNHKSKYSTKSFNSIASLPTSPRAVNQMTSTPAGCSGTVNPHLSTSILSENAICRICHEGDGIEELVAPCYCAGTVGALHLTCLERWLGTSNTTRCEICQYQFKVERQSRAFWQVILKFLRHPSVTADRRNMMCDVICFLILTPLTGISAFLCMMGVQHYAQWDGRWEVPGLAMLTCCLLVIYTIWCCVAMRHHYKVCREWQNQNQIIKIRYLSPTRGKTIIEPKINLNKNQSHRSPTRQHLISPCTSTPSRYSPPHSFNQAMLRPILRYSVNLEAFTPPSNNPLDANFTPPHPHSDAWTENEGNHTGSVIMSSCISEDLLKAARETYV